MPIIKKAPSDLRNVAAVAQCMDNQWLPPELVDRVFADADRKEIMRRRDELIKHELMAALLTSEQLVLNRAFALNNDVFASLYQDPLSRPDFERALDSEVITFCFLQEHGFHEPPQFRAHQDRVERLAEITGRIRTACVRLSWDDSQNQGLVKDSLALPFHQYVLSLQASNKRQFARDFGIAVSDEPSFFRRLDELSSFAATVGGLVNREQIYGRFINETQNSLVGSIDRSKPFARELKAIVDLKYNLNLADALDRYGLTSQGDCDRSILQEMDMGAMSLSSEDDVSNQLATLLSSAGFSKLNSFQALDFLPHLELADVLAIRDCDEWKRYVAVVQKGLPQHGVDFFHHPLLNDSYATELVDSHIALLARAHSFVEVRELGERTASWCEFTISLIGTAAKIVSKFIGEEHFILLPPDMLFEGSIAHAVAPLLVEFAVTGGPKEHRETFLRKYPAFSARISNPKEFFARLKDRLQSHARRSHSLHIGDLSIQQFRDNDRCGSLNPIT